MHCQVTRVSVLPFMMCLTLIYIMRHTMRRLQLSTHSTFVYKVSVTTLSLTKDEMYLRVFVDQCWFTVCRIDMRYLLWDTGIVSKTVLFLIPVLYDIYKDNYFTFRHFEQCISYKSNALAASLQCSQRICFKCELFFMRMSWSDFDLGNWPYDPLGFAHSLVNGV